MYWIIYIYLLLVSFFEIFVRLKLRKILKINIFLLIFFTGFRYYNGTDYGTYLTIFTEIKSVKDYSYLESGFRYIIVIIKNINNNIDPKYFFLIFATLGLYPLYRGIKREIYPNFALFIYYCIFLIDYNFNGVRQSVIMGIYIYSILFIIKRENKKSIFYFICAFLIHKSSAIIFGISAVISRINYKLNIVQTLLFFTISILVSNYIIECLKFSHEIVNHLKNFNADLKISSIIMRIGLLIIIFSFNYKNKDIFYRKLINIYSIGFIIYGLFFPIGLFSTRINMLFRVLEVLILPYTISKIKNKSLKILVCIIVIVIITLPLIKNLQNKQNVPYKVWILNL